MTEAAARLRHARLPWIIFGAQILFAVAGTYLEGELSREALFGLAFMSLSFIGALVASRLPENRLGWVLLALVGFSATGYVTSQYAIEAEIQRPGSLPFGEVATWISGWVWIPGTILLITFVPLLFPDGKLPSQRWRWVARAAGGVMAFMILASSVMPGPVQEYHGREILNPLGIDGAQWLEPLFGIAFPATALLALACTVSLFVRFAKGDQIQRQQLKVFGFAALLITLSVALESALDAWLPPIFGEYSFLVGIFGIAAAIGLAIFKYRLYDIDVVINKALVYAVLSALLAGVYVTGVVIGQSLVGRGEQSDLAIAASTLLVAALFQPIRRRVQAFIDRLFYRAKYDAARELESLNRRLRDEVDLETLQGDVLQVVRDTVRPSHAGLWVRT